MATPVFDCVKNNFPQAEVACLVRKRLNQVVEDGPWFDHVIEVNDKTTSGLINTIRLIRRSKPDMTILLRNSIRSTVAVRLGGAQNVYGYRRNGRSVFLTGGPRPIRQGRKILPLPMVDYYLEIISWMGFNLPKKAKPRLFFSDTLKETCDQLLEKHGINSSDKVIGLNPGARFGSSKCWPPEYFARVAELFQEAFQAKLLLFVGPGEDFLADVIMEKTEARIINTAPDRVDLALLKPLMQRCQLLVTNDTGPRHYAVAFDTPAVVIMGPTDPRYTASNLEKTAVLRHDVDCSPCHKRVCPRDHVCMKAITPAMVFEAGKKLVTDISSCP